MYYVNVEQIEQRLQAIPEIAEGLRVVSEGWEHSLAQGLIQERCLHLAIEVVTDVCSYLIDGFIMRDASSYEDIVEINYQEKVFSESIFNVLIELVKLRKPLVQEYFLWDRSVLHPLTASVPDALEQFAASIRDYLKQELGSV